MIRTSSCFASALNFRSDIVLVKEGTLANEPPRFLEASGVTRIRRVKCLTEARFLLEAYRSLSADAALVVTDLART